MKGANGTQAEKPALLHADPATWPEHPDPLWQHVALPHCQSLGVLGLRLDVATNSEAASALAGTAFGRFRPTRRHVADIHLDVIVGRDRTHVDGSAPGFREHGHLFVADDGHGSRAVADLDSRRVMIFVADGADPARVRRDLVEPAVWRAAGACGLVAMHAATVEVDGTTFVLRGVGGAGKSTLACLAAASGHTVVAEEVSWVDLRNEEQVVRGAPWVIHLDADSLRWFPALEESATFRSTVPGRASADGDKFAVAMDDPGQWRASDLPMISEVAPLGPLVFLDRALPGEQTSLEGLAADAAWELFAKSRIPGEYSLDATAVRTAVEALCHLGAWRMRVEQGAPESGIRALEALAVTARETQPAAARNAVAARTGESASDIASERVGEGNGR